MSADLATRIAFELGRCEAERDTYKCAAEMGHELHQDVIAALPLFESVYDVLTEMHPELSDTLYEGIQRLRGERPEPAINERMVA